MPEAIMLKLLHSIYWYLPVKHTRPTTRPNHSTMTRYFLSSVELLYSGKFDANLYDSKINFKEMIRILRTEKHLVTNKKDTITNITFINKILPK